MVCYRLTADGSIQFPVTSACGASDDLHLHICASGRSNPCGPDFFQSSTDRRTIISLLFPRMSDYGTVETYCVEEHHYFKTTKRRRLFFLDGFEKSAAMSQDNKLHNACLDGELSESYPGKLNLVQQYLSDGVTESMLNEKDGDGRTPLHWAASSNGKLDICSALDAAGPLHVDEQDASGWTPLMIAASAGADRIVTWLLEHGADPTAGNARKLTALHYACSKNHTEIARALLEAGADVNAQDGALQRPIPSDRLGNTPLHLALDSGHAQTAGILISEGEVDRNRPNAEGILAEQMEGVGGQEQKRVRDFLIASFGPP